MATFRKVGQRGWYGLNWPVNNRDFLPGNAPAEITLAVGYPEPNAGTDLASLRTRAELDGDEWIINESR